MTSLSLCVAGNKLICIVVLQATDDLISLMKTSNINLVATEIVATDPAIQIQKLKVFFKINRLYKVAEIVAFVADNVSLLSHLFTYLLTYLLTAYLIIYLFIYLYVCLFRE